jgi:hypothetical protein
MATLSTPSRCSAKKSREDGHRVAYLHPRALGGREACRHDVGAHEDVFVGESIRDPGEVRLRVGHPDVLGLAAVDGVAEAPATDGFEAVAAMVALSAVPREARSTLAARRDGTHDDALAWRIADDTGTECVDTADELVTDRETRSDRILPFADVDVGAADRRQRHAHQGLAWTGRGPLDLAQLHLALGREHVRSHLAHGRRPRRPRATSAAAPPRAHARRSPSGQAPSWLGEVRRSPRPRRRRSPALARGEGERSPLRLRQGAMRTTLASVSKTMPRANEDSPKRPFS